MYKPVDPHQLASPCLSTVEKPGIELLFQLANLESHSRLGHMQLFSRFGKIQQPSHSVKNFESPVRHI